LNSIFDLIGMGAAVVTGHTGDRLYYIALIIFVHAKKFFVDPDYHFVHVAGDSLLRFRVAGKVEVVVAGVGVGGMAEIAFDAQRGLECIHCLIQIVVADVFWKDFEVPLRWFVVCGTHGGHSDYHQGGEDGDNCEFFVMQHVGNFGIPR
jgi:hypothetical protein